MLFHFQIVSRQCFSINQCVFTQSIRRITQSYYDILKVSQTCTTKEVRDAFIVLSKKNHPDKHLNDPSMHEKFVQINEAYSTLINPSKRRAYDLTLYNKRKLNAPFERDSSYSETFHRQQSSGFSGTRYDDSDQYRQNAYEQYRYNAYEGPFSRNAKRDHAFERAQRKTSNRIIVTFLVMFTILGAVLQMLAIRRSFMTSHQNMVEHNKEYGMIHRLARERAKMYGNAKQIDILKNNLNAGNDEDVSHRDLARGNEQAIEDSKERCKRHDNLNNTTTFCPKHTNNNISDKAEENVIILNHDNVCKKCNKRINK